MDSASYKEVMKDRALRVGAHLIETKDTFKKIAYEFNCSPSTVRRLIRVVLPELNPDMANKCDGIINYHRAIAHLRGGEMNKIMHRRKKRDLPKAIGTTE